MAGSNSSMKKTATARKGENSPSLLNHARNFWRDYFL